MGGRREAYRHIFLRERYCRVFCKRLSESNHRNEVHKGVESHSAFSVVLYFMHSMARNVPRAYVPVVWGWFGRGRMFGSHDD